MGRTGSGPDPAPLKWESAGWRTLDTTTSASLLPRFPLLLYFSQTYSLLPWFNTSTPCPLPLACQKNEPSRFNENNNNTYLQIWLDRRQTWFSNPHGSRFNSSVVKINNNELSFLQSIIHNINISHTVRSSPINSYQFAVIWKIRGKFLCFFMVFVHLCSNRSKKTSSRLILTFCFSVLIQKLTCFFLLFIQF